MVITFPVMFFLFILHSFSFILQFFLNPFPTFPFFYLHMNHMFIVLSHSLYLDLSDSGPI